MSLRDAWESEASAWAAWARIPDHDRYFWRHNLPRFLELVPPPGRLTVDLGCGEGRVGRALTARGHRIVSFDGSPTLARLAATHDQPQPVALADAAALPAVDACADLVVAFMSLQDVDDLDGAVGEAARVLVPGGRLCIAVVHPLNSAGAFTGEVPDAAFVIEGSYLDRGRRYTGTIQRDGLTMTFHSLHHSLEGYTRALEDAGLLIEAVREPAVDAEHLDDGPPAARWTRVPLFLHLRAMKPRYRRPLDLTNTCSVYREA